MDALKLDSPFIKTRKPRYGEIARCSHLVRELWGDEAAKRCHDQFVEYFRGGVYAPVFMVATDDCDVVIGFAAYHRTMQCTFNIIWLVVIPEWQRCRVGKTLVAECLNCIEANDGMLIEVITQVPEFYMRHGFTPGQNLGNGWWLQLKPLGEFGL